MATRKSKSAATESAHSGLAPEALAPAVEKYVRYRLGCPPEITTAHHWYQALASCVRDQLMQRWQASVHTFARQDVKVACYLSAEFLMGPQLGNSLLALGIEDTARAAMRSLGQDLDVLLEEEEEPGLGNGGLGRLAACYMDSLATLEVPAIGYGIHYEFGIFDQVIRDGWQEERTDQWLARGNPWELLRADVFYYVNFGGHTEQGSGPDGRLQVIWHPGRRAKGIACDMPVPGYRVNTCNTLRLWKAAAEESFDFQDFNQGDYYGAVQEKILAETLTKVLYPNDEPDVGKRLRLAQQYFFVSCSLQDMLRLLELKGEALAHFPQLFAVQLNDTHPAIAVAELMRLLVDERGLPWDDAWDITTRTFAYTNHTLLPEALETWGLPLFQQMLPRPLDIIFEINRRFLETVRARFPGDDARLARLSLIDETGERRVRMANLATVGSHSVNGVARLHSELLTQTVLRDFAELWPEKFRNVTNGVTPRRFVALSNPGLARLLDATLGEGWLKDLSQLQGLESFADDPAFREQWQRVKRQNKLLLAQKLEQRAGVTVDADALFDIQVKRIHEYKRQHLNLLHVITQYQRLRDNPQLDIVPRCVTFGGKAAPGYRMAKLIIRLINGVAQVVNNDPLVAGRLQVAFFPDFNVKNAHFIYPAADLSQQISTAGKEASGTGNMKFTLNGALTIGTLDGANVEIRDAVGADHFFLFGQTAEQVAQRRAAGYRPQDIVANDPELRAVLDLLGSGLFANGDDALFQPLRDHLLWQDDYQLLADYRSYLDAQARVEQVWRDHDRWMRASILNVARAGRFSSDRAIAEYCEQIWQAKPVSVTLEQAASTPATVPAPVT